MRAPRPQSRAAGISICVRLQMTARKLTPLRKKQVPIPSHAISNPAAAGTEHARAVEHHRVERDRVGEIVVAHHLDHERLAAGHVERTDGAVECGQQNHVPDADGAGPGQRREREGAQHQQDLSRDNQAAAIDAVNHYAGEQTDQQDRRELRERDDAEHRRRVRQLQHQPRLRGALHPGAGERGQLAEEIETVVAMAQRAKRAAAFADGFTRRLGRGGLTGLDRGRGVNLRHGAPTCC